METFLEYMTFVKGIGYLLVVAFLLAFVTFWKLVHTKETGMMKAVPMVVVMWMAFGATSALFLSGSGESSGVPAVDEDALTGPVFPEYHSNGSPAVITTQSPENWLGVNPSDYSAIGQGSAGNFHKVMSEKMTCKDCHHNSGDKIRACKDCHSTPFNPYEMDKPGLKAAIHETCMSCHKELFNGPDGCRSCHTLNIPEPVSVSGPVRPHELTWENCAGCHKEGIPEDIATKIVYHDFCVKCHTQGINGAAVVPADHASRTVDTCKGCHGPAGGE
ncbi:MAG: cytochrome c3 family protein [Candidatus Methanoperedens sp.]|nr:cytochrome c3 family protein [Candidatus Methanoperedens sp.]